MFCSSRKRYRSKNFLTYFFLECVQSYGENCNMNCSKNCVNQTCDRQNGRCINGCKDGTNCDPGIFFYI